MVAKRAERRKLLRVPRAASYQSGSCFPVGARAEPAVLYPNGENPSAVAKIFTLERTIEPGQSSSFDVSAPELSAIARIDLDSVDYADKSNWNHAGQKACQAELQAGEAAGGNKRPP